jgi:hypothetical protein
MNIAPSSKRFTQGASSVPVSSDVQPTISDVSVTHCLAGSRGNARIGWQPSSHDRLTAGHSSPHAGTSTIVVPSVKIALAIVQDTLQPDTLSRKDQAGAALAGAAGPEGPRAARRLQADRRERCGVLRSIARCIAIVAPTVTEAARCFGRPGQRIFRLVFRPCIRGCSILDRGVRLRITSTAQTRGNDRQGCAQSSS